MTKGGGPIPHEKKRKVLSSLDELYDESGNVLCRFCEECTADSGDEAGYCNYGKDEAHTHVLLDAAECDCGVLFSKELAKLNKRMPKG